MEYDKNNKQDVESHVTNKFILERRLGRGAYGIVWRVREKESNKIYALKKIFDAFRNKVDSQRTYREICFLKEFSKHPNIIFLHDVLKSNNKKDIYLVFDYMITDLDKVIRRGNVLEDEHRKYISYQICLALCYIHSANVIHRDLKPANVLLNEHCTVKLCDFGMARSIHSIEIDNDIIMTDYIATRWYRAPEILLASNNYTSKVDIWSYGCIIGEMIKGKPLFQGTSTMNMIDLILKYFPPKTKEDLLSIKSNFSYSLLSRQIYRPVNNLEIRSFIGELCSTELLNLLLSILNFNPCLRITAKDCLDTEYLKEFRNKNCEIFLDYDVIPPINDSTLCTIDQYRTILFDSYLLNDLKCERRIHLDENKCEKFKDKVIKLVDGKYY